MAWFVSIVIAFFLGAGLMFAVMAIAAAAGAADDEARDAEEIYVSTVRPVDDPLPAPTH
jgi:hypothetical protein